MAARFVLGLRFVSSLLRMQEMEQDTQVVNVKGIPVGLWARVKNLSNRRRAEGKPWQIHIILQEALTLFLAKEGESSL